MKCLICYVAVLIFFQDVNTEHIDDVVQQYFESPTVEELQKVWLKVRRSCEKSISLGLKEAFGTGLQNIFLENKNESPLALASAYFLSDRVIDILLLNLTLKYHIPRLRPYIPDVSLALSDNLITVNADLDTIFAEADYYLFRNKSDILFEGIDDPYQKSPFTLQQVQKQGKVIIAADECKLAGLATTAFKGLSVSLGFSSFQVTRCQFRIEIHKPGLAAPPIMAPYFSVDQGRLFERLLSGPISKEITPKLQGLIFSMINTTSVFDLKIGKIRNYHRSVARKVNDYMKNIVATMNKVTSKSEKGFVSMPDFSLTWNDAANVEFEAQSSVLLKDMTLNGLETAYCAQAGGPYRVNAQTKVADEIRFQELQVRGQMHIENTTHKELRDFTIELLDVAVIVKMALNGKDSKDERRSKEQRTLRSTSSYSLEFSGWRSLEYYVVSGPLDPLHQLAVGYTVDEVPRVLVNHLNNVFGEALQKTTTETNVEDDSEGSKEEEKVFNKLRGDKKQRREERQKRREEMRERRQKRREEIRERRQKRREEIQKRRQKRREERQKRKRDYQCKRYGWGCNDETTEKIIDEGQVIVPDHSENPDVNPDDVEVPDNDYPDVDLVPDEIIEGPVTDEIITDPVPDDIIGEPVTDDIIVDPITDDVILDPATDYVIVDPVTDDVIVDPVTDEVIVDPVDDENKDPNNDGNLDPPNGDDAVEPDIIIENNNDDENNISKLREKGRKDIKKGKHMKKPKRRTKLVKDKNIKTNHNMNESGKPVNNNNNHRHGISNNNNNNNKGHGKKSNDNNNHHSGRRMMTNNNFNYIPFGI